MKTRRYALALSALALAAASFTANAGIVFQNLGVNAPPAVVGGHVLTPFDLSVQNAIPVATLVTSIPGNPFPGSLDISPAISKFNFSNYSGTWGHGYGGAIYSSGAGTSPVTYTLTLPPNTKAFYFYGVLRTPVPGTITAVTDSGTNSGPVAVTTILAPGPDSANGFAFYSTAGENIASITISSASAGVILAEFGINAVSTTCASEGYTGTKLTWCQNICEKGYTGATLDIWIHRWINRYRDLPYCAVEGEPELPPQEN
ncbi:MAG TPA: hypothetical protein VLC71_03310 [Thermomonas sp.]|nr:hypothetical protein [Thermomonas sp.]